MPVIVVAVVLALAAPAAYADLMPMSWGFPTLIQNSSLTALENNFAWQNDFEFTDISFPTSAGSFGLTGIGSFPTITQTSNKVNMMSSFKFMNQQESAQFSYPWYSIGFSPVPSMGFL